MPLPTISRSSPLASAVSIAERTDFPKNDGTAMPPCSTSRTTVPFAGSGAGEGTSDVEAIAVGVCIGCETFSRIAAGMISFLLVERRAPRPPSSTAAVVAAVAPLSDVDELSARSGVRYVNLLARMVGRAFCHVCLTGLFTSQQNLAIRGNLQIVRGSACIQAPVALRDEKPAPPPSRLRAPASSCLRANRGSPRP